MSKSLEGNYIKASFKFLHELRNDVTTNTIVEHLFTKPSSVIGMVRILADINLVNCIKYRGDTLTSEVEKIANLAFLYPIPIK